MTENYRPRKTKEELLKGIYVEDYFSLNKRGEILPSTFHAPSLSKDIRKLFPIKTMEDNLDIYIYNEEKGHYDPHGKNKLRVIIKKALGDFYEEKFASATIDDITASTTVMRKDIEPPLYLLAFKNGILNIECPQYELLPHTPALFFTSVLPVDYKPNIGEPKKFLKFLEEVQPDIITRLRLQEYAGYMLYRRNIFELGTIIYGHENSGKSTFCNVIIKLLGEQNITNISVQELSNGIFAKAQMYHKFALIRAENPTITIRYADILKTLISGDMASAQYKYGKLFDFRPYAKILIGVNKIPYSRDTTRPFIKRWDLIEFPNKFQGENCDRFLVDKLTTPEELSGILNWALEGLHRLLKNKKFTGLKSIEERKKIWLLGSSSLYRFCQDHVVEDQDQYETKDHFYESYLSYCEREDLVALDRNVVSKQLIKICPTVRSYKPKIDDKQVACWKGIMIVKKLGAED